MPVRMARDLLGEVIERETRTATLRGHEGLPDDTYAFAEAFCDDPGCDCRRALIHVFRRSDRGLVRLERVRLPAPG